MRLWHQSLIPYLSRQHLLGQHRECCALRGMGWGKKHSVVDYVFIYNPSYLVAYHNLVMDEMERRGYHPDINWRNPQWRGNVLQEQKHWGIGDVPTIGNIYPEHDDQYLTDCLNNLIVKNAEIYINEN